MKKHIATSLLMIICMAGIGALAAFLLYAGFLRFNYPSFSEYPVQGIDVSNHQNEIDWEKVDKHQVQFAFIKATEGGDFKDKSFIRNWVNARREGIVVGAYHFFTFCKSGEEQAQNFIETVPVEDNTLPPAIDLEYSGNCKLTKTTEELLSDITVFINILEEHYNKKVIIYVTEDFYNNILFDKYLDNPLWLRDIYAKPKTSNNRTWTFWQFGNRGKLSGIETFVDLNVYSGSTSEFQKLLNYNLK